MDDKEWQRLLKINRGENWVAPNISDDLIIHDLPGGVIYIENAFTNSKNFLDLIEKENDNKDIHPVVPPWSKWVDGYPVRLDPNDNTKWDHVFPEHESAHRGLFKNLDWDETINNKNSMWPRKEVDENYSEAHKLAEPIYKLIEPDLFKSLKIWREKTGSQESVWVTRNYCIRKYRTGGDLGTHIDRNIENPLNTMDWTALIYLNDDYTGGELVVNDYGYCIQPKAGSVVILPCLLVHSVKPVLSGTKTYIFLFMHTERNIVTALGEPYQELNKLIDAANMV